MKPRQKFPKFKTSPKLPYPPQGMKDTAQKTGEATAEAASFLAKSKVPRLDVLPRQISSAEHVVRETNADSPEISAGPIDESETETTPNESVSSAIDDLIAELSTAPAPVQKQTDVLSFLPNPLAVTCPNCKEQTVPSESLLGGRVRCGKCKSVFQPASPATSLRQPARARKKKSGDEGTFWEKWKKVGVGLAAAMVLIYIFFPTGSSGKPARVAVIPAQGKADFEGQPIPEAAIFLHPVGEKTPAFPRPRAVVQSDGTFVVGTYGKDDGAPAGEYKVTVQWFQSSGKARNHDPLPVNLLPPRYGNAETSALSVHIQEGENANLVLRLKR